MTSLRGAQHQSNLKVLVIGSGGREDALCWMIAKSKKLDRLYCAPGNAGIARHAECVSIKTNDIQNLLQFAKEKGINLTLVGPEAPLVEGIVDVFIKEGLCVFGPDRYASQLEGSKIFSKNLMQKLNIPTAGFAEFDDPLAAKDYVSKKKMPVVVKADGLAAGKGVTVADSKEKAIAAIEAAMVVKVFGKAGEHVLIEDCLEGVEASLIAICDGNSAVALASSQDHKRVFDGDRGPNTGGMGAYSPAAFITPEQLEFANNRIFNPIVKEMKAKGHPFVGFLYAGVMITASGLRVLEFNVRFGDPEAQAILPRLKTDFLDLVKASTEGRLSEVELDWLDESCACVVLSSKGYPGTYPKGLEISGLKEADDLKQVQVFHAGTLMKDGKIVTHGGRVLGVAALGKGIQDAVKRTYEAVQEIKFDGMHYRKDIAKQAITQRKVAYEKN
jgi:phosphoribosylamine---glycine ligase